MKINNVYVVEYLDFPSISGGGDTVEEALCIAKEGLDMYLESCNTDNKLGETNMKLKDTLKQIKEELGLDIKYIARDSNGRLYGYTHEPFKALFYWNIKEGTNIELDTHKMDFLHITFDDKKAYKVEDLIE